jgi:hypothetical protein
LASAVKTSKATCGGKEETMEGTGGQLLGQFVLLLIIAFYSKLVGFEVKEYQLA